MSHGRNQWDQVYDHAEETEKEEAFAVSRVYADYNDEGKSHSE